jgi:hypothetical protein
VKRSRCCTTRGIEKGKREAAEKLLPASEDHENENVLLPSKSKKIK